MPIYEYECGGCGGRFEVSRKFSDPLLSECTLCKSPNVKKVLSPTAFVLKGSGWYVTDYASGDRKKALEAEKPKSDAPAGATEKSTPGCSSGACAAGTCPSKG